MPKKTILQLTEAAAVDSDYRFVAHDINQVEAESVPLDVLATAVAPPAPSGVYNLMLDPPTGIAWQRNNTVNISANTNWNTFDLTALFVPTTAKAAILILESSFNAVIDTGAIAVRPTGATSDPGVVNLDLGLQAGNSQASPPIFLIMPLQSGTAKFDIKLNTVPAGATVWTLKYTVIGYFT